MIRHNILFYLLYVLIWNRNTSAMATLYSTKIWLHGSEKQVVMLQGKLLCIWKWENVPEVEWIIRGISSRRCMKVCFMAGNHSEDKQILLIWSDCLLLCVWIVPQRCHQLLTGLLAGTTAVPLTSPPDRVGRLKPQQKRRLLSAVMLSDIHWFACRAESPRHIGAVGSVVSLTQSDKEALVHSCVIVMCSVCCCWIGCCVVLFSCSLVSKDCV